MYRWYILIHGKEEGPYSLSELKRDRRLTLDTLVRREGSSSWVPIREVPELRSLFDADQEEESSDVHYSVNGDVIATTSVPTEPGQFLFWAVIVAIIILWMIQKLFFI